MADSYGFGVEGEGRATALETAGLRHVLACWIS